MLWVALGATWFMLGCQNTLDSDSLSLDSKIHPTQIQAETLPDATLGAANRLTDAEFRLLRAQSIGVKGSPEYMQEQALSVLPHLQNPVAKPLYQPMALSKSSQSLKDVYVVAGEGPGFALVSADTRLPGVLAYTQSGVVADLDSAWGWSVLLAQIGQYIEQYKTNTLGAQAVDLQPLLSKINNRNPVVSSETNAQCGPEWSVMTYLDKQPWSPIAEFKTLETQWGQWSPFNDNAPQVCDATGRNCRNAPAGCIATALAQLMAHWQFPQGDLQGRPGSSHRGINWELVTGVPTFTDATQAQRAEVAWLTRVAGNGSYMDYTYTYSRSTIFFAREFLRRNGYELPSVGSYNVDAIVESIAQGRPVYIAGSAESRNWLLFNTYHQGHAWLLTGVRSRQKVSRILTEEVSCAKGFEAHEYEHIEKETFIYNNFGWDGRGDAWLAAGIFEPEGYGSDYRLDVKVITDIRPGL
jgi:hypothetical protein